MRTEKPQTTPPMTSIIGPLGEWLNISIAPRENVASQLKAARTMNPIKLALLKVTDKFNRNYLICSKR